MNQVLAFTSEFLYGLLQDEVATDIVATPTEPIQIALAPNPASTYMELQVKGEGFIQNLKLYDAMGRLVQEKNGLLSNHFQLKRNQLATGLYHLHIQTNKGSISKKVILK